MILLAAGSILLLLGVLALARLGGAYFGLTAEVQRKCVHISIGVYAFSFPYIFEHAWQGAVVAAMALTVLVVIRFNRSRWNSVSGSLHAVDREGYGELYFGIAIACLLLMQRGDIVLYLVPVAVMTFADAAAGLIGSARPRRYLYIGDSRKSVAGSFAFFVVAWVVSALIFWAVTDMAPLSVFWFGAYVAAFGTLLEALSWGGLDNLLVPFGLFLLLDSGVTASFVLSLATLVMLSAGLIVVPKIARLSGVSAHLLYLVVVLLTGLWLVAV